MLHMILAGLVTAFATQAPASGPTVAEPLSVFTGDWQIVDTVTGKILMGAKLRRDSGPQDHRADGKVGQQLDRQIHGPSSGRGPGPHLHRK